MKPFIWPTVLLIGVAIGVYATMGLELAIGRSKPLPEPVVRHVPPSDEQLVEFWFGKGDKAALRKRICK